MKFDSTTNPQKYTTRKKTRVTRIGESYWLMQRTARTLPHHAKQTDSTKANSGEETPA